ncbi:MAG: hypothetical protein KDC84_02925 [Crocinitomicaceae bacterium]|nr:hypothetical protein [Crocinitomicaceae bacterium]
MLDSLEIALRKSVINDGGPLYHEFVHEGWIKEPWNAFSSLFFFIPVIYWIWKLRGEYRDHLIMVAIIPLLFLNGLGSTLYHAFRSHEAFLLLDWMPASAMSVLLATYFWTKVVYKWYFGFLIVFGFYLMGVLTILFTIDESNKDMAPNIGYFFVGSAFFIPIFILLYKNQFKYVHLIAYGFVFLALSLVFRTLDYPNPNPLPDFLPQGTHFLWHVFSSFAVFSIGYFIYYYRLMELAEKASKELNE